MRCSRFLQGWPAAVKRRWQRDDDGMTSDRGSAYTPDRAAMVSGWAARRGSVNDAVHTMCGYSMPRDLGERVQRREVLLAGLCWPLVSLVPGGNALARQTTSALPTKAGSTPASPVPFGENTVADLARALAAAPFRPQDQVLPDSLAKIGYDQYRGI